MTDKRLALVGGTPVRSTPYPRWPEWDEAERAAVLEVLESGGWWREDGKFVARFEAAFAALHETPYCIAVTNGTHAIEIALQAAGIGDGDTVIVPDYTFMATAAAVVAVNATPVLVDIDPRTLCLDPDAVRAAIDDRTRAIIAVHLAGHPADLDRLIEMCRDRELVLIEDCAHAHGSSWRDRRVGGFGAFGTFSFQQSKLMTAGEGGAIVATDEALARAARSFHDCGRREGHWFYDHFVAGANTRMTEWQAAVLLAQAARFEEQNRRRNENALVLARELGRIPGVTPQGRDPRTTSQGYYCFVFRVEPQAFAGASRDDVVRALEAEGIPTQASYPPVHRLRMLHPEGLVPRRRTGTWPEYSSLDFPQTERAAAETVWLKHQVLLGGREDVLQVAEAMEKVARLAGQLAEGRG